MLGVLGALGLITPHLTKACQVLNTPMRILTSMTVLFPMGLVMGGPFPMGLKLASGSAEEQTPWLWGLNGATSVWGSVLAAAISLSLGISCTFWLGLGCYAAATLAFACAARQLHTPSSNTSLCL